MDTNITAEILAKLDHLTIELAQVRAHLLTNTRLLRHILTEMGKPQIVEEEMNEISPQLSELFRKQVLANLKDVEQFLKQSSEKH
jgi:uncharacterized protein (UPF0128 family)